MRRPNNPPQRIIRKAVLPQKKKALIPSPAPAATSDSLQIIGMGASAGGLEALEQFFKAMPADSGMAFVIVSHLDPERKSLMPELLQRITTMQVSTVTDGIRPAPNQVYIIPPNTDLSILNNALYLTAPMTAHAQGLPIDFFFSSLALDQRERAIAIILSGMGSDGSLGIKAIKEHMGMVMAQDEKSAKFNGMLQSAMATGLVDIIAPAGDLPAKLLDFVRVQSPKRFFPEGKPHLEIEKIIALLRSHTGHDFSLYKRNTLERRVERRMGINRIEQPDHYLRYLQESVPEREILFKELLIGVTHFFRDPEAFEALAAKAIPALLKRSSKDKYIRVWVPGCSSGEEAYSMAMLLSEQLDRLKVKQDFKIQIFATDLDKNSIEKGRRGAFQANIVSEVSAERLKRFFIEKEPGFQVKKEIREMVIFAVHDIIKDPPFTNLDILCCRNLLIYFDAELQKRLIPLFHYAIRPNGILFLGTSENVFDSQHLFTPLDKKWKIFQRTGTEIGRAGKVLLSNPAPFSGLSLRGANFPDKTDVKAAADSLPGIMQQVLLNHGTLPAVLVNAQGDILYVHGHTGRYLEPLAGRFSNNILTMAREGLRHKLADAIPAALSDKTPVVLKGVKILNDGDTRTLDVTVRPLHEPTQLKGSLLVVFKEISPSRAGHTKKPLKGRHKENTGTLHALREEIQGMRERLHIVTGEMQASQEELRSALEEFQSTNEELQSTNEELMTSKEEMQSLNEELMSVNAELQMKIDDLSRVNSDMQNLLNNSEFATVFLDLDLNVRRFTEQATRIINLIPADVGRPIAHIVTRLKYDGLQDDLKQVIDTLIPKELEVETKDGTRYLMRIAPYRTLQNAIDGAVLTFADITQSKRIPTP